MKQEELNEIRSLIANVEYISYQHGIYPALFRLVLQCMCRAPFASYSTIIEFIKMIRLLAEADKDYNLLLKASILTGQFPDYRLYKHKKQKKLKKAFFAIKNSLFRSYLETLTSFPVYNFQ